MPFIKTHTGQHIDYRNVTTNQIVIEDTAIALSNIYRFAGHVPDFYSVPQHAVLCSQIVPAEFALEALMHDAAEAYCQDIPAPLKRLLPDYQRIEVAVDIWPAGNHEHTSEVRRSHHAGDRTPRS